jgi:hypothetical protein
MTTQKSTIYRHLADSLANVMAELKVTYSVQNCENFQIWIKIKRGIKDFSATHQYQVYSHETHAFLVTYFQIKALVSHTTKTRLVI